MARLLSAILLGCIFAFLIGCADIAFKTRQDDIAKAIGKIPVSKAKFLLYSLDPDDRQMDGQNTKPTFHGYRVLGYLDITPEDKKDHLLRVFADGVRKSGNLSAVCFEPRHGLSVIGESFTNDL